MSNILEQLAAVIESRKGADPQSSYVASLLAKGTGSVLKKIGEESAELVMAATQKDRDAIIHETADLWFHTLVMLSQAGLEPNDVFTELEKRFGKSGIEEKASRKS